MTQKKFVVQLKVADMVSMTGAALLGLGAGIVLKDYLTGIVGLLMILGVVLLGLGMYGKFEIEHDHINPPTWVMVIFGLSWISIMLAGIYLLIGHYAITVN